MDTFLNLAGKYELGDIVNSKNCAWQILKNCGELSMFPGGTGVYQYYVKKLADRCFTKGEIFLLKSMREENLALAS